MAYQFAPHLIMRMPAYTGGTTPNSLQFFLDSEFFRSAVYLASPTFFNRMEQSNFSLAELTERERLTLQKYINRYCYRPTPFGLFSSVSLIAWGTENKLQPVNHAKFRVILKLDQGYQTLLSRQLLATQPVSSVRYEANPSLYRILDEFRFIRTETDNTGRQREYLLQSIPYSNWLNKLIAFCRHRRGRVEIVQYIEQATGCTLAEGEDYLDFLTDAQFLVNELRANITGDDYLKRLAVALNKNKQPKIGIENILHQLSRENNFTTRHFMRLNQKLKKALSDRFRGTNTEQLSVTLHRDTEDDLLSENYRNTIEDALSALKVLIPETTIPAMEQFIQSFRQHFDGQTVPLLKALDPETGIGYQNATSEKNNPLLETLHIPQKMSRKQSLNWSAVHSCLLNNWHREPNDVQPVIRLSKIELKKLETSDERPIMGMSVLFRVIHDQVYIESAGGINAPALLGRFTIGSERFTEIAKDMARLQEEQNPGIIFAELLHLADPHVDNINRRASLWRYELPITAVSLQPDARQIALSDLYISVFDNRVLLYSAQHGKLVIPKLTSAYNYSLNRLPLFRFLAALPYQYGRYEFGLDLSQYFPDLDFYPRVEYRSAILSLATWILNEEQLTGMRQPDNEMAIKAFRELSQKIRLPEKFSLTEGDQQLVFNQQQEEDILFFANCVRQKTNVVLQEFPDQPEVRQFNAFVLPSEPINLPSTQSFFAVKHDNGRSKRQFIPGSEWLYLKIYAPKLSAEKLLLKVAPLLRKQYGHGSVKEWFFIRYEDHAPHIRLRMKVVPEDISEILASFQSRLETRIKQHVIREYQVDVYTREMERYEAAGIEKTEYFFFASSKLVLSFLQNNRSGTAVPEHRFALYSVYLMITCFLPGQDDQLVFTKSGYLTFLPEFEHKLIQVELDKKYRELSPEIGQTLRSVNDSLFSGSVNAGKHFQRALRITEGSLSNDSGQRLNYLSSIIHMHLNRIFVDESRKQEMIVYYLLHKFLRSVIARSKKA